MPSLRNEKEKKKRVLVHALTARLPSSRSPSITILRHITSEYNAFSIKQPFMKLKEMEQLMFGKPNCGPKLVIVDYRKVNIKAVLDEFSRESLYQYLDRAYNITIHGDSKTDDFSRTFIHVSGYHFIQMGRQKFKEILKSNKNNSQIHFAQRILARLICYTDLEEARRLAKDIHNVLTSRRSFDLAEY